MLFDNDFYLTIIILYTDTMKKAREMLKRLVDEGLTSYESEKELGRGKRRKRPPTTYTDDDNYDDDEDSNISNCSQKLQLLSDDSSDSDLVTPNKIRKSGKSQMQDIPVPPPLSFQNRIGNKRPDQNKNRKITETTDKNIENIPPVVEKMENRLTKPKILCPKQKEDPTFKKCKSTLTLSQVNTYAKSSLQQMNIAMYQSNTNIEDEDENVINKPETEIDIRRTPNKQNSSKTLQSKDTKFPSSPTSLKSLSSMHKSTTNPTVIHSEMSQDTNDNESFSFGKYIKVSCWFCYIFTCKYYFLNFR